MCWWRVPFDQQEMRAAKWLKSVGSDERWDRLRCCFVVFERRSDSVMVPFAGCARYSSGGLEVGELLRLVVRHWLYAARSPEPVFASWPETTAKPGVNACLPPGLSSRVARSLLHTALQG